MRTVLITFVALLSTLALASGAFAQTGGGAGPTKTPPTVAPDASALLKDRTAPQPRQLSSVDVDEHLNQFVPLDLAFNDEDGKAVTLGQSFNPGKPVLLTLNYLGCPMLCTLVLNGMVESLRGNGLTPGKDYQIVTVSFNPVETHQLAKLKQEHYLQFFGDSIGPADWHFLTGQQEAITSLTGAVGFKYHWIASEQTFAHPAVIMVLTPDGRLSRYLYGVQFDQRTLKLSLLEAGKGKIGTPLDKVLLYCYHYDPTTGSYTASAMRLMRIGGALTLIIFAAVLAAFWVGEKKRARRGRGDGSSPTNAGDGPSPLPTGVTKA